MAQQYYLDQAKRILDDSLGVEAENGIIKITEDYFLHILGTALEEQAKELY